MMSISQMSLQASAMICAIVVIRALGMGWLPKWSFQALWGVALLRLLLPVRIESPLSVYRAAELPILRAPVAAGMVVSAPAPTPMVSPWLLAWGIGAALLGAYFLVMHLRSRRLFAEALPLSSVRVAGRNVPIRTSDRIGAPLTYGVLRPVVLLPSRLALDGDAHRYVLAHELTHVRRMDVLKKWLLTVALCVHWFNPLVWAMYILANRDMELSCDESVLRQFGEGAKARYATMLIDLMERRDGPMPLASHFGKNAIEERIIAIMKHNHRASLLGIMVALILVIATASALATSAVTGPTEGPGAAIEWWTADEFEEWLDEQRAELPEYIGSRFWDEERGWYTMSQDDVDETIAMYEATLADIRRGASVSKDLTLTEDIHAGASASADQPAAVEAIPVDVSRAAEAVDAGDDKPAAVEYILEDTSWATEAVDAGNDQPAAVEFILEDAFQVGAVADAGFEQPVTGEDASVYGHIYIHETDSGEYIAEITMDDGQVLRVGPYDGQSFEFEMQQFMDEATSNGLLTVPEVEGGWKD